MREFDIFRYLNDGRVYGILKWLKHVDAETMRPRIASSTLRLELCHCPKDALDMLANGIRHMLADGEIDAIDTAPEKESLLLLLYLKAYSIHAGFTGTLQPLFVRAAVVRNRLEKHDAETVIGIEERYCHTGLQLCAHEALHWDEYLSVDYDEPLLISEMIDFLSVNSFQTRKTQYEDVLQRVLTKRENDLLDGYAVAQTAFLLDWLNDYNSCINFLQAPPRSELQAKIDAYFASVTKVD